MLPARRGAGIVISGNLFTRDYLLEAVVRSEQWTSLDDSEFLRIKEQLRVLVTAFAKNANPNEAETERDVIYPVLSTLGWTDISVQPNLSTKGRKQVPDALLLADDKAKAKAVAEPEQWKRFQHGLAVLEAKRWDRSLDRASKGDEGVPATQILQYLSRIDVQTSGRLRLGILTNGQVWRLYWQGALSVAEDFFEIDLAKALGIPDHDLTLFDQSDSRVTRDHCLRLFILIFSKSAFLPSDGARTFHDIARDTGKTWEEKVTKDLSILVFGGLFPKLVTAIAASDTNRPKVIGREYLEQVRQSALILLYRLLFVVYAEDRDLLPSSQEPYKDYSLTAMRLEIARRKAEGKAFSSVMTNYWPRLVAIFKALSEGDNTLGIPPYNGGLFAKEGSPLLAEIQLPDTIVTDIVYGLSHRIEDGEPRYINYRDLSVQQLGSVYERTLEYGLTLNSDDEVVPTSDDTARHESGSYYTPDSLVMLIIDKTIGPFVEERLKTFRTEAARLASDGRSKAVRIAMLEAHDPARAILSLKICDPAMGSGHFLVSLVDWLADKVLAAMAEAEQTVTWADNLYQSPLAAEISKIRTDIIQHSIENSWPYVDEHLQDRHIVRRMVLKRCVYGVDKNPLAVELAKVALWLHTFTVGAPLSFLDHHLRCGNSLFGAWVRPAMDRLVEWGSPLLMDAPRKKALGAAAGMQTIEKLTDADIAEVYQSRNLFEGIESMTSELSDLLTLVCAIEWQQPTGRLEKATIQELIKGTFGDPIKVANGKLDFAVPPSPVVTELERKKRELQKTANFSTHDTGMKLKSWLPDVTNRFSKEHWLHWQVAFPGIWRQWESADLHGGFDAVIGNPPYVRQEIIRLLKPSLKRAFPETYDGNADLYVYFYDQGLRILKPGGRLSYVVTNKWMRSGYAESLRRVFADKTWIEFVADFGHAKKFFPDADVFPSIIVARKPTSVDAPLTTEVCVIPRDDVPEKALADAVAKATYTLPRAHFTESTWALEPPRVVSLLEKLRRNSIPLRDFTGSEPLYGIKTGLNEAFLIDAADANRLLQSHPALKAIIRPYLRGQDIRRWSSPDAGLFMIMMKSSSDHQWPWHNAPDEASAEKKLAQTFPELHAHFKAFEEFRDKRTGKLRGLRHREDQGRWWWELRPCSYYEAFSREKICIQRIAFHPRFSIDGQSRLVNDSAVILPTQTRLLAGILNQPIAWYYQFKKFPHKKDEALAMDIVALNEFPIPSLGKHRDRFENKVSEIIELTLDAQRLDQRATAWLRHQVGLISPKQIARVQRAVDSDDFVSAIRDSLPKRRNISSNEMTHLATEYAEAIVPLQNRRADVFRVENELSHLVNSAYGLTPDEVQLMWHTAPPRMPTSHALAEDGSDRDIEQED
ncbi:Eco57I restriction-modification methylase domain-containing protein [Bradyrhizobium sp.]|uniref:Eco57I restriction-modification methylase domain-containing protein n=1 Tax=Bradyrhizobium sp. TaxID=376 RepID=UPI0025BC1E47|nr:Eco57I restriction-modification methylase domain-containing protein [Bradyrhizobium sp.]